MSFFGDVKDLYARQFTKQGRKASQDAAAMVAKTKEDSAKAKALSQSVLFLFASQGDDWRWTLHDASLLDSLQSALQREKCKEEFQLSTKDNEAEVLIYDNHGTFKKATVPFAAVISGDTMILGWRGTISIADRINDAAASPQSSFAWRKHAKTIKAHGAFTSIVHNALVTHEAELINFIKANPRIKEIVTTG